MALSSMGITVSQDHVKKSLFIAELSVMLEFMLEFLISKIFEIMRI